MPRRASPRPRVHLRRPHRKAPRRVLRLPLGSCLVAFLSLGALPAGGAGQAAPLVVEARVGAAVPALSFADGSRAREGVEAGPSFSVEIGVSGSSRRTFTVGFSQHRFGCGEPECAGDRPYVATGMNVGLRLNLRSTGDVIPWLRLAGRSTRVELPARGERPAVASELGFGGEVGAGLYVGTFRSLALNPGVRLAAVNTGLPGGGLLRMRYWVADLGVSLAF
mgnify:CR=1 FL=1